MKTSSEKYIIEGKKPLKGAVDISGSKNAALPILCAALLTNEKSTIHNVPDIADIHSLLKIFEHLNVKTTFENNNLKIDPSNTNGNEIPTKLISSMRASILLIAPLLAKYGEARMPFPGGCVLGKRSLSGHTRPLRDLGVDVLDESYELHLKVNKLQGSTIIMPEISVTGTENAVMLASITPGKTEIRLAAAEPHVQDLCHFLNKMGAKISGIGSHYLTIEGVDQLRACEYTITGDYLEVGTFAIASILTGGEVTLNGIDPEHLDSFWEKLNEAGAKFELNQNSAHILPSSNLKAVESLRTAVYPSFPTDLQAPFAVLLTQAEGESKIFETLFDGRLQYLYELEKMGAKVEVLNPHQAIIKGPTPLKAVPISSLDIRAGAAMVLAALCAEGTTDISNINYINRGYEKLDDKLISLGASIKRKN
jgi:UDP-N-acetylglucosamine 1-carboxyvinyltransferase